MYTVVVDLMKDAYDHQVMMIYSRRESISRFNAISVASADRPLWLAEPQYSWHNPKMTSQQSAVQSVMKKQHTFLDELEKVRNVARGGMLIIDGGLGTEIEKHVTVENSWWGNVCFVQLEHRQVVEKCHTAFINAGADIIIANTYCCNRNILYTMLQNNKHCKYLDDMIHSDADADQDLTAVVQRAVMEAVEAARRSVLTAGRPVLIAGSIGCHKMIADDGSTEYPLEVGREMENYLEEANDLIDCGVDMIFLELIGNVTHDMKALEATARAVAMRPCPVFIGIGGYGTLPSGEVVRNRDNSPLTSDIVKTWMDVFTKRNIELAGINIMHIPFHAVLAVVNVVKEVWDGRIGCYPDLGVYKFPHYELIDIDPDEAVEYCKKWRENGVTMVGGCCGIGPELISKMKESFNARNECDFG